MKVPSWNVEVGPGASGGGTTTGGSSFNTRSSAHLWAKSGPAGAINAAFTNRGIGNEGLSIAGSSAYEGHLWAWVNSDQTTLLVGIRDYTTGEWRGWAGLD